MGFPATALTLVLAQSIVFFCHRPACHGLQTAEAPLLLWNSIIPLAVLGGLTVILAGGVASVLVLQSIAERPVIITGVAGTLLANPLVVLIPLPPLVEIQLNAVTVYPVWATTLAVIVAIIWKLARMAAGPEPSPAEREAELIRKARARAEQYRWGD
jgi:hypothetical protein